MVEPCTYSSRAKVTWRRPSRSSEVNPEASTPRRFAGSSESFDLSTFPASSASRISASKFISAEPEVVFFPLGGRNSRCNANHALCARATCLSCARANSLGHVRSSLWRHRNASLAHNASWSLSETCAAAPSSQVCARASSSSSPVSACFRGLESGNCSTRSQISASCDKSGWSGHSTSRAVILARVAATGATTSAISPAHPPSFKSAPSASAAASAAGSCRVVDNDASSSPRASSPYAFIPFPFESATPMR